MGRGACGHVCPHTLLQQQQVPLCLLSDLQTEEVASWPSGPVALVTRALGVCTWQLFIHHLESPGCPVGARCPWSLVRESCPT